VTRPESIRVIGYDLRGNEIDLVAHGLLARVIQHEFDHLQGTLFIDRVDESERRRMADQIEEFESEIRAMRESGKLPSDAEILERLLALEKQYC
jgi:peptide deformylase